MIARTLTAHLALASILAVSACGDDDARGLADATATADPDATATADPDATATADPDATDDDGDVAVELGPLARVYPVSPTETPELEEVTLRHLTAADGSLVGDFARVRSCRRDLETGQKIAFDLGGFVLDITACTPTNQVFPGSDGTYRDTLPPATPAEDDGRYAEVMMYHHMQLIHDYFKDVHGLTDRDHPLDAVTNLQAHIALCDEWATLPNAAFIPEEALDQLPLDIDLGVEGDAIVFSGTATKNFGFDASVIYHEYTHAILGATRLSGIFFDEQGLNNLPGALNEAYADYFALTLIDRGSVMGTYTLNDLGEFAVCGFPLGGGGNQARDLVNDRTCPGDLTAEVHADSEIFSAALWEIRALLGAEQADAVILAGVETLTNASDFAIASEATIDAALELVDGDTADAVEAIFEARNLLACERVVPIERVGSHGLAITLPGPALANPNPWGPFMPGYVQYVVDVPEGAAEITLTFELQTGGGIPGFGGGGDPPDLSVALKPGSAAIVYTVLGATSATHDAVATLPVGEDGTVRIAGSCLAPGPLVFGVHNAGGDGALAGVTMTSAATASGEATFDGCEL